MKPILILVKSKYGASRRYAGWLAAIAACDLAETKDFNPRNFDRYETIVLMGGVYAGTVAGVDFLKKHRARLKGKTIAVFAVGASPADAEELKPMQSRLKASLPEAVLFYGRGCYDEQRMNFADRTLCRMLKKSLLKKDPATLEPWARAMLESEKQGACDWCDPDALKPLCSALKIEINK